MSDEPHATIGYYAYGYFTSVLFRNALILGVHASIVVASPEALTK